MTLATPLLGELAREAATTRRLLERVPDDRLNWQPHARSMTLAALAVFRYRCQVRRFRRSWCEAALTTTRPRASRVKIQWNSSFALWDRLRPLPLIPERARS